MISCSSNSRSATAVASATACSMFAASLKAGSTIETALPARRLEWPPVSAVDPGIFKAYDVRGIYPDQIDEDVAYRVGRAFARVLGDMQDKAPADLTVGLGRDMRLSAPDLADRYAAGPARRGRRRARRRDGGHRDALLRRRLARAWTAA